MSEPILLRPHHLLCLQNFEGRGYSPDFTSGMEKIHALLTSALSTRILVEGGPDTVCMGCPNQREGRCSSIKPDLYDQRVLALTGLTYGRLLTWKEALDLTSPLNRDRLPEICGDCQWASLCALIRSRS